ncbi:MAG TPA: hypothetical protein VFQ06_04025, partial [Nitrospira sp.]|nr:hypothetical protein [Nitrospira sp.]
MIQVWTYVLEPPDGADVDEVGQLLAQHMSRMAAQSEEIIKAEVASQTMDDTTSLLLAVWFQG